MSDPKVMGVLQKLRSLQDVLKRNGQQKVIFNELVATEASTSDNHEPSLEHQLQDAKDAVVNAVMNDLMEQEKALKNDTSSSKSWLHSGDKTTENGKSSRAWGMKKVGFGLC